MAAQGPRSSLMIDPCPVLLRRGVTASSPSMRSGCSTFISPSSPSASTLPYYIKATSTPRDPCSATAQDPAQLPTGPLQFLTLTVWFSRSVSLHLQFCFKTPARFSPACRGFFCNLVEISLKVHPTFGVIQNAIFSRAESQNSSNNQDKLRAEKPRSP